MPDIEKITYAKSFIDKLANGVNPLDGTEINEGDIVNNVRISRCLFFVSEVLQRVIDESEVSQTLDDSEDSGLTEEIFTPCSIPLTPPELARRIGNSAGNIRVSGASIGKWLYSIGFIDTTEVAPGKKVMVPTDHGKEMGITNSIENKGRGPRVQYFLDENAQQFVYDNIEAVIDFRAQLRGNKGKTWTAEDDEKLTQMYENGVAIKDMANELKRSVNGVYMHILALGLFKVPGSDNENS